MQPADLCAKRVLARSGCRMRAWRRVPVTDRVQRNGAAADVDAVDTREWLEALDAVVACDGPDRARALLTKVIERAHDAGASLVASLNTRDVNTIRPEREARLPGDPAVERRLRSIGVDRGLDRDRVLALGHDIEGVADLA
jgi:hypothetical protein